MALERVFPPGWHRHGYPVDLHQRRSRQIHHLPPPPSSSTPVPVPTPERPAKALSPARRVLFTVIAVCLPVLLVAAIELGLRLGRYGPDDSLFVAPGYLSSDYLVVNPALSSRYFPG